MFSISETVMANKINSNSFPGRDATIVLCCSVGAGVSTDPNG